jgi:hypothetical protein
LTRAAKRRRSTVLEWTTPMMYGRPAIFWLVTALVFCALLWLLSEVLLPLAAAIAVLFRFGLRRYQASPIYTGGQPT